MSSEIEKLKAEIEDLKKYKERLELYEDASFESIAVIDENFNCIECNKQLTNMFYYTQEEMNGKFGPDLVAPEFRNISINNGKSHHNKPYEALMLRKDGSKFWGLIQGKDIIRNNKNYRVITVRDISRQKDLQKKLVDKNDEFEAIFNNSQVGIILVDGNRIVKKVNDVFNEIVHETKYKTALGMSMADFHLSEESYAEFGKFYGKALLQKKQVKIDYQFKDAKGKPIWVNVSGRAIDSNDPPDLDKGVVWVAEDINTRKIIQKQLHEAHDELKVVFDNADVGILLLKDKDTIYRVNNAFAKMHGYDSPEELQGKSIIDLYIDEDAYYKFGEKIYSTFIKNKTLELDYQLQKKDGTLFWVSVSGKTLDTEKNSDQPNAIWVVRDITERKENETKLKKLSRTDSLTNIYNRRYFMELAERERKIHLRHNRVFSFMMLDIDHFKSINDQYGHHTGDKAIKLFVKVCKEVIRGTDIFGRLGGEEFAIVLTESNLEDAVNIANRLRKNLIKTTAHGNSNIPRMTVSIGLVSSDDDTSIDDIMKKADKLLYKAKENGRNRVES